MTQREEKKPLISQGLGAERPSPAKGSDAGCDGVRSLRAPGPWQVGHDHLGVYVFSPRSDTVIAQLVHPEAAQVVAAAPDLLAALKAVELVSATEGCACGSEGCSTTRNAWAAARAAIAKAEETT